MLTLLRRAFPVVLVLTATWMSHQSVLPGGVSLTAPWDKVAHGCGFFFMGLVAAWGWGDRIRMRYLLALLLIYGGADEIHQAFVPGRDASLGDWIADGTGAMLGLLAWRGMRSWLPVRFREAA